MKKTPIYKSSLFAFAFIWARTNSAVGFAFVCSQASPTVSWLTLSWAKSGNADILLQLTQSCETATHVHCNAKSLIRRVCKKGVPCCLQTGHFPLARKAGFHYTHLCNITLRFETPDMTVRREMWV